MPEPPRSEAVERYLADVARRLRLPPTLAVERLDELALHIRDTVESGVGAGLDRDEAERKALARLGPPDVLGDELRRAEQTPGRTLAAVGGAAVAVAGGVVRGWLLGFLLLFAILLAGAAATRAIRQLTGVDLASFVPVSSSAANVAIVWVAAVLASRAGAEAFARGSRRRVGDVRPAVAVVAGVVAALVVARWRLEQDWLSVAALLALPPVAALAALTAHDAPTRPRRRWVQWLAVAAAATLLPVILLAGISTQVEAPAAGAVQTYGSVEEMWQATGWDRVGRPVGPGTPSTEAFADAVRITGPHGVAEVAGTVAAASIRASATGPWTGLRLEVWRAAADLDSGPEIDPSAAGPDRLVPLGAADGSLAATVRLDDRPGADGTWAVLTGIGPDGTRYVLAQDFALTPFVGTAFDWLAAVGR